MLPLERVSLPHHPEKVLAIFGHQPCARQFHRYSRGKWRHQELPGCLNAWISIMRRISSKCKAIRCQRSSRTCFSSLAWLMRCTRYSSLQWCRRPFPSLVATRFRPSQVSQRTVDLNQRCRNRRSPPQAPQRPANGSRSESPRLPTPTQIRPMSLPRRRNSLLEVSKSRSPVNSGNATVRPQQAAPKMVPLPPRYERSWKPMTLRPQPLPDLLRPLSRQLSLSCMTRTFLKSRKSVPESSVFRKERRPPRRISTPCLTSD